MKVICIDGAKKGDETVSGGEVYPVEGLVYTAIQHFFYNDSYDLLEMPSNHYNIRVAYRKVRFVPLSSIDEMELLEQRQEELVSQ